MARKETKMQDQPRLGYCTDHRRVLLLLRLLAGQWRHAAAAARCVVEGGGGLVETTARPAGSSRAVAAQQDVRRRTKAAAAALRRLPGHVCAPRQRLAAAREADAERLEGERARHPVDAGVARVGGVELLLLLLLLLPCRLFPAGLQGEEEGTKRRARLSFTVGSFAASAAGAESAKALSAAGRIGFFLQLVASVVVKPFNEESNRNFGTQQESEGYTHRFGDQNEEVAVQDGGGGQEQSGLVRRQRKKRDLPHLLTPVGNTPIASTQVMQLQVECGWHHPSWRGVAAVSPNREATTVPTTCSDLERRSCL